MTLQAPAILLPCHSLEDFPHHHEGDAAEALLAGWTALWHPTLLAGRQSGPVWHRADDPPESVWSGLLVVPSVSEPDLPVDFDERVEAAGGRILRGFTARTELLGLLLESSAANGSCDDNLAADFLALGFAYLQIQLLTRQMRYSSNLDDSHFAQQLLAAADAAISGEEDTVEAKLTACFDMLAEERDHYYSVDAYLIDLTLLDSSLAASPTIPAELAASTTPTNWLATARVLEQATDAHPALATELRERLEVGTLSIVGGEYEEQPLPLYPCERVLASLRRGATHYETLVGRPPTVFGRRRCGLTPILPAILDRLGYTGALHFTLEEGVFPQGSQVKTRWEGCDGTAIDALAKVPFDAALPETFLSYAHRLGESMDMDHVATLVFAHWPDRVACWYEDLRRCARFGPVLGQFVTVENYFSETYMPGHAERFTRDRYVSAYLRQAVQEGIENPLSTPVQGWQNEVSRLSESGLGMLQASLGGETVQPPGDRNAVSAGSTGLAGLAAEPAATLEGLQKKVEQFASRLPRGGEAQPGVLVVNPLSAARRVLLDVSEFDQLPAIGKPIFAAAEYAGAKRALVDVPAMGFTWVTAAVSPPKPTKSGVALAEDCLKREGVFKLRNEYFEASIDPQSGGLRGLKDYEHRDNRLSQQVALRRSERASTVHREVIPVYTKMRASRVEICENSPLCGAVRSVGEMLDDEGNPVGKFEQTLRATRGSRVLELELKLRDLLELDGSPWESHFCLRFAWSDEAAELYAGPHELRQRCSSGRIEAPNYLEIDTGARRTALLVDGLPYHRNAGPRMLDSLLVVRGEQAREFRVGIAVDTPSPLEAARQFAAPVLAVRQRAAPPAPAPSSWLFHLDVKHVSVTAWEPIVVSGRLRGVRLRLLETMGRTGPARLTSFRPFVAGRRVDFQGRSLGDLRVAEGRAHVDLMASEWAEFELWWEDEDGVDQTGGPLSDRDD